MERGRYMPEIKGLLAFLISLTDYKVSTYDALGLVAGAGIRWWT